MSRQFATLTPKLQASVPGCPHGTILQYIRDAAIRACERTLAWRHQVPVFNFTPGVQEYPFVTPANTNAHAILEVLVNNWPMRRLTLNQATAAYPQWTVSGSPRVVTQLGPASYAVLPVPDTARPYQCRMFLALKPSRDAVLMDVAVFDELEEVIMHGALQHLLVLPDQIWSDRELAAYHAKQFVFQVAERRARAELGNARATLVVQPQPFGN